MWGGSGRGSDVNSFAGREWDLGMKGVVLELMFARKNFYIKEKTGSRTEYLYDMQLTANRRNLYIVKLGTG